MSTRRYDHDVELASVMVTARIHENRDRTIFLLFENEHGEYGITITCGEASALSKYLGTAAASVARKDHVSQAPA